MKSINEDAYYILIGKILVDCNDIKKITFLGYEPKDGTVNEPDKNKLVCRIIFNDDTYWESVLDKTSIEMYNNFKKNENSSNASE